MTTEQNSFTTDIKYKPLYVCLFVSMCVCMFSGSSAPRLSEFLSSFQAKVSSPRNNPLLNWPLQKQKHTRACRKQSIHHPENYSISGVTRQLCLGAESRERLCAWHFENVVIWNVGNGEWKLQWSHLILIFIVQHIFSLWLPLHLSNILYLWNKIVQHCISSPHFFCLPFITTMTDTGKTEL